MKAQILREVITNNILQKLGFNTRVKFLKDPTTYYIKNVAADKKSVFVTNATGLGLWNKKLNLLVSINDKLITESINRNFLIKESYKHIYGLLNEEIKNISKAEAENILKKSNGKTFTVEFVKKDGSRRRMNAQLGVKKYLKGGQLPYDPASKKLLPVFDLGIKSYRVINLNTVYYIRINNQEYTIN